VGGAAGGEAEAEHAAVAVGDVASDDGFDGFDGAAEGAAALVGGGAAELGGVGAAFEALRGDLGSGAVGCFGLIEADEPGFLRGVVVRRTDLFTSRITIKSYGTRPKTMRPLWPRSTLRRSPS